MNKAFTLLLIIAALSAASAVTKTCKALVFEDSDDLGAYQVGAFKGLVYNLAAG